MSWFRTFIRRHLIADDPAPEYSRLDHLDGLTATPANHATGAEELDTVRMPSTVRLEPANAAVTTVTVELDEDA